MFTKYYFFENHITNDGYDFLRENCRISMMTQKKRKIIHFIYWFIDGNVYHPPKLYQTLVILFYRLSYKNSLSYYIHCNEKRW